MTLTALKHLGGDTAVVDADNDLDPGWRMVRIGGEIALVQKPADDVSPPRIDCYRVVERSASGAAFKLDPWFTPCAGSTSLSRRISSRCCSRTSRCIGSIPST